MRAFGEKLKTEWKSYCTWKGGPKRVLSKWDIAFSAILIFLLLAVTVAFGLFSGKI